MDAEAISIKLQSLFELMELNKIWNYLWLNTILPLIRHTAEHKDKGGICDIKCPVWWIKSSKMTITEHQWHLVGLLGTIPPEVLSWIYMQGFQ